MSTTPKPTKVDDAVTIPVDDELIGSVLQDSDSSDSSDEEPEDSIEVMDDVESSSVATIPQPGTTKEKNEAGGTKEKMKKICLPLEPHPITETMNPCVRKKKNMVALKAPVKDVLKKLRLAEEQAAASVAPSTSAAMYICTYEITVVATTEGVFLEPFSQ